MNLIIISFRLLFSKKQFSYTNISIFLSMLSFMLAVSISLLVIGVSRGYKDSVEIEISNIEPDLTIRHPIKDYISLDNANLFIHNNTPFFSDSTLYAKYIISHAMIKKKNYSKGVLVYAMEKEKIREIFNFNYITEYADDSDFLFISNTLSEQIHLTKNEELYIFDIEEMIQEKNIKGIKNKITGVYESNIKTFDKKVIFMSLNKARKLFNVDELSFTGIMIENVNEDYLIENISTNLLHETWEEKHQNLLNWLMIFSNPIKLILAFILILSIIYKIFTFWLILYDKSSSLNYLKVLGVSNITIHNISFNVIVFLSLFSIIFGSMIALLLSIIQNKYQIITVNPDIYILPNIKSIIFASDIIYLSIASLFLLILFSGIITYLKFKKISLTS
tara:strand:- start:2488 stop:3660 length:1173 start_codon:yes stop_codon:yes gene_type:complete